jgi:cystathionine beta-lyase
MTPSAASPPSGAFDFDSIYDRRNSDSAKWKWYPEDVLPMWVADMDFRSPPAIMETLHKRVDEGLFGYAFPPDGLSDAIVARMQAQHGWAISGDAIVYLSGLVSGLNVATKAVGEPGEGVLVNTPVYGPFLSAPENQGRTLQVAAQACTVAADGTLYYEIDFDALEAALLPSTRMLILCHPANPTGRAWTRAELEQLADFALRHDLIVCSDEIHAELLLGGATHIPFAAISPEIEARTITLLAPSKTFNIPGLGASLAIIPDATLRKSFERAGQGIVPHMSLLSGWAMYAAYTACDDWLAALRTYLTANRDHVVDFVQRELPGVRTTRPEATYLAWLDLNGLGLEPNPAKWIEENARVAVNDGAWFGEGGAGFVRLNFGCPRATLDEGLQRLRSALAA